MTALSVANHPGEGDEVVDCGADSRVFLDPVAATRLSERVPDARRDAEASYRFSLRHKQNDPIPSL